MSLLICERVDVWILKFIFITTVEDSLGQHLVFSSVTSNLTYSPTGDNNNIDVLLGDLPKGSLTVPPPLPPPLSVQAPCLTVCVST